MNQNRSSKVAFGRRVRGLRPAGGGRSLRYRLRLVLASIGSLVATQGCATGRRTSPPGGVSARAARVRVPVDVESSYVGPVLVYVEEEGAMRVRLGTVTGSDVTRLYLPPDAVGGGRELRLIARPVGSSREAVTDEFKIELGDHVLWTLMRPIETSIATLRIALGSSE